MSGFAELLPAAHRDSDAPVDLGAPRRIEGRDVYVFGANDRPVFALHELPGFTRQFIAFCRELAARGFTVYAPLLFGRVGERATNRNFLKAAASRDWFILKDATPRIIGELRRIRDAIHAFHPGRMGAIGMCFTGQLPVALLDRDYMNAAVLSQPSMPFMGKSKVALDAADIETAKRSGVPMIAFRFATDDISPAGRQARFEQIFGAQLDFKEYPASEKLHAVLTETLFDKDGKMKTSGPSLEAFEKTHQYLAKRL